MKKSFVFLGLSNKVGKEVFDRTTPSGNIVEQIKKRVSKSVSTLNLVPIAPLDEFGKLRYPTKEEIQKYLPETIEKIKKQNPKKIVCFGQIVYNEMRKWYSKDQLIYAYHPSYIWIYKRKHLEEYISDIVHQLESESEP